MLASLCRPVANVLYQNVQRCETSAKCPGIAKRPGSESSRWRTGKVAKRPVKGCL